MPCFAVAAVNSGEQNGLNQIYYFRALSSEIIFNGNGNYPDDRVSYRHYWSAYRAVDPDQKTITYIVAVYVEHLLSKLL